MVGKLSQGESVEVQVTMLYHGHEASHHIISLGAVMPEKNIYLGLFRFVFCLFVCLIDF